MVLEEETAGKTTTQSVLIVDDHPLFRAALRDILGRLFAAKGIDVAFREAACFEEAFELAAADPDLGLVTLDVSMPDSNDLSGLLRFRSGLPSIPVVVVSAHDNHATIGRAMLCGAAGFIPKSSSADEMAAGLRTVLAGGIYMPAPANAPAPPGAATPAEPAVALTPRQAAVLAKLIEGKSNKIIARELSISDMTVKVHVTAILRGLGVETRAQAIVAVRGDRASEPQPTGS